MTVRLIACILATFWVAFSFPAHAQSFQGQCPRGGYSISTAAGSWNCSVNLPSAIIRLDAQYGVVGDNATDNSTAIASAITAANATGNVTLVFPRGTSLAPTMTAQTITAGNVWLTCDGGPNDCVFKPSVNNALTWSSSAAWGGIFNLGLDNAGAATNVSIVVQSIEPQFRNIFLGTGIGTFLSMNNAAAANVFVDNLFGKPGCSGGVPLISWTGGNGLIIKNSTVFGNCTASAGRTFLSAGAAAGTDTLIMESNFVQIFDSPMVLNVPNTGQIVDVFLRNNIWDGMNNGILLNAASGGNISYVNLDDAWIGVTANGATTSGACIQVSGAGVISGLHVTQRLPSCFTSGFVSNVTGTAQFWEINNFILDGGNTSNTGGTVGISLNASNSGTWSNISVTNSRVSKGYISANTLGTGCLIGGVIDHLVFQGNDCQGTTNYSGMLTGTSTTFAHTNSKQRGNIGLADSPDISTFANRPTNPATGMTWNFSDGLAANCADTTCTTFGTNVTGGTGALQLAVRWNGTNWTLIGK